MALVGDGAMQIGGNAALLVAAQRWQTWADPRVVVHEASSGRVLQPLAGHGAWVESSAFSGDGRLVTLGVEGTLRVWDWMR